MVATTFKEVLELAKSYNVIPVYQTINRDDLDPYDLFDALRKQNKLNAFLESCSLSEKTDRYAYLCCSPCEILKIRNGKAILECKNQKHNLKGNPFDAINDYMEKYQAPVITDLPPFIGGAVGYVGYDAIQYYENIPLKNRTNEHCFEDDALLMVFKTVVSYDSITNNFYIISSIYREEGDLAEQYSHSLTAIEEIIQIIHSMPISLTKSIIDIHKDVPLPEVKKVSGESFFRRNVKKIQEEILQGNVYQCVLSERFEFKLKTSAFNVYNKLRQVSPTPYMFYLELPEGHILGAAPEKIVEVSHDGNIYKCVEAGTRPRGVNEEEDNKIEQQLLNNEKEKAEHIMLLDLGRNDLGRVSKAGSVNIVEYMSTLKLSHVMHISSRIHSELMDSKTVWNLFTSCFPAGEVTGAPKIKSIELIDSLEPVCRGAYAGAVVYHSYTGALAACMTIRSLIEKNQYAYVQAGAGIVADSIPSQEYTEVNNKVKSLLYAVGLASQ